MSVISALPNYVKFIRGTPIAYANLTTKDPDTLYFISEANADTGCLYLGSKLISGNVTSANFGEVVLSNLGDKQILAYDANSNTWKNVSVTSIVNTMVGATAANAGERGLVPVPAAGDQNKFLRGDGTWALVTAGINSFNQNIFAETSGNLITLKNFSSASANSILQKTDGGSIQWVSPTTLNATLISQVETLETRVNGLTGVLKRTICTSVNDIDPTAENAEYFIYMVPTGNNNSGNLYDEYMVVNGAVEQVGSGYSGNLSGYVTTSDFNTALNTVNGKFDDYVLTSVYNAEVGNLQNLIITQSNGNTVVDQVNDLTTRLTWHQISDS